MHILLISAQPPPYGGIANWVLLMQKYMKDRKDDEIVGIVNIAPKVAVLDGRTLWNRVVGQGLEMLKLNRQLKKEIKEKRPDVIHLTTSGALAIIRDILFLKTAKKKEIPVVYHIRFGRVSEISKTNTIEWRLMKRAVSLSSRTMAIDERTYQVLKHFFGDKKIVKVANPFDISSINVKTTESTGKVLLFLGWCVKTKGVEELLTAWEKIHDRYPDWLLRLVGPVKDIYRQELQNRFSMNQVVIEGEKEHGEAMQLLKDATVFILPSYTEGFPNVVLEAMAFEKPIIATDVGAIAEMLENNAGIVIPTRDSEAIVGALEGLLHNQELQLELGRNAKNHLLKNYAIEIVVDKYKRVWNEVTGTQ